MARFVAELAPSSLHPAGVQPPMPTHQHVFNALHAGYDDGEDPSGFDAVTDEWRKIAEELEELTNLIQVTTMPMQQIKLRPTPPPTEDEQLAAELAAAMALPRSGLQLHYQPLVNAVTGRLTGFEALLRWTTLDGVAINPMRAVELANRFGLAGALDMWVVGAAIARVSGWVRRQPDLVVAVNVTSSLLTTPSCAVQVEAVLHEHDMQPGNLCIEVTETVLLDEQTTQNLLALRALGVRLAIDDFGTGFSALSRLMDLPVDTVKLDRSFIMGRTLSVQDEAFLEAMVRMGHARGATVTIEGVSRPEDVALARRIGCDNCQGYWFAQALSVDFADALVASDALPWHEKIAELQN